MRLGILLILLGAAQVAGAEPTPTPTPQARVSITYYPIGDPKPTRVPLAAAPDGLAVLKPRLKATMRVHVVEVSAEHVKFRYPGEDHLEVWETRELEWIIYPSGRRQEFAVPEQSPGTRQFHECVAVTLWWIRGAALNNGALPEKTVRIPDGWVPVGGTTLTSKREFSGRTGSQPVMVLCR